MNERFRQFINWTHQKRVNYAAGAVLSLAAAACSSGEASVPDQGVMPITREPAVTEVVPTNTSEPLPTAKPELAKFSNYDIFVGNIEGGGQIILAMFADGKVVAISGKTQPLCTAGNFRFAFMASGTHNNGQMDFATRRGVTGPLVGAVIVKGTINDLGKVSGSLSGEAYSSGSSNCPAGTFTFEATKVGNGLQFFLDSYRTVYKGILPGVVGATDSQNRQAIEAATGVLPQ